MKKISKRITFLTIALEAQRASRYEISITDGKHLSFLFQGNSCLCTLLNFGFQVVDVFLEVSDRNFFADSPLRLSFDLSLI